LDKERTPYLDSSFVDIERFFNVSLISIKI